MINYTPEADEGRVYTVSTSPEQDEPHYTRRRYTWPEFVKRMKLKAPKAHKDCGNVVGGAFKGDYRLRDNLEFRSVLALDADTASDDWAEAVALAFDGTAWLAYTTFSHTPTDPRWRLMTPLSRDVTDEEYWLLAWAVMLTVASGWDKGGAEAERLMHRPSTRGDGSYAWRVEPGAPLDVDAWLKVAAGLDIEDRGTALARSDSDADAWLAEQSDDEPCAAMRSALEQAQADLADAEPGQRYPTMLRATLRVVRLGEQGHAGLPRTLDALRESWEERYGATEDHGDWTGQLLGAVRGVTGADAATPAEDKGCCPVPLPVSSAVSVSYGSISGAIHTGEVDHVKPMFLPSPAKPAEVGDALIKAKWTNVDDCRLIRYWMGDVYEWHETHWERMPPDHLESYLQRVLQKARYRSPAGAVAWNPTPTNVAAVVKAIKLKVLAHAKTGANQWLDCTNGRCPVGEDGRYMSFANGILDLDTGQLLEHESAFFNTWSLRFDYQPDATCARWEAALEEWFPGDSESRDALEEVLGYLLLGGMEYDKAFMFLGEPRSGKGTVMRLIASMIGPAFTTQSLDDLADRFGLEDLLNKTVCHFSEAAASRSIGKVVSLVKSITGQDEGRTVKMKGAKSQPLVNLSARFVFAGNEELTLPDESGVIIDRLVLVSFMQSFLGKENTGLTVELIAESSGIFNRLNAAYDRLVERGRFVQPKSGAAALDRLRTRAAPDKSWWDKTVEVTRDPKDEVRFDQLVDDYLDAHPNVALRSAQMTLSGLLEARGLRTERVRRFGEDDKRRIVPGVRWRLL